MPLNVFTLPKAAPRTLPASVSTTGGSAARAPRALPTLIIATPAVCVALTRKVRRSMPNRDLVSLAAKLLVIAILSYVIPDDLWCSAASVDADGGGVSALAGVRPCASQMVVQ